MDRLRSVEVFLEIARDGSFSAAARRLAMSKASVTKYLAALERDLGCRLLQRTTKQVGLTQAGEAVLADARLLTERFAAIEATAREATQEPRGIVRIGTPPSFGTHHLLPLVADFTARHPDIQVSILLDDGRADLISQGLDLTIRIGPAPEASSSIAVPLAKASQVLVAAPRYIAARGMPAAPADLARHNCLVHALKSPTGIWRFAGPTASAVRVSGTISSTFGEALKHAALRGEGIAVHPHYMVAEELARGDLVAVLPDHPPLGLDIYALFSSRRNVPTRVRTFVDHLKAWARTPTPWTLAAR